MARPHTCSPSWTLIERPCNRDDPIAWSHPQEPRANFHENSRLDDRHWRGGGLRRASFSPESCRGRNKVPSYDKFIVVPLRVHVLTAKDLDLVDARITDAEVARAIPKINAIWSKAGIHFGLESIVRGAAQVERFKTIVELNDGQFSDVSFFAYLFPASSRGFDGLHVYLFRGLLNFNGGYLPVLTRRLSGRIRNSRKSKGAAKTRSLGLRHEGWASTWPARRPDQVGLLSPGTNGVGLNEVEVGRARQVAKTIPGAFEVDGAAKAAEAALTKGDITKARQLWTWLSEVPGTGTGAAEAKKKLLALPAAKP